MYDVISFLFGWVPDWLIWVIMGVSTLLALNIFIRDTVREEIADIKKRLADLEKRLGSRA